MEALSELKNKEEKINDAGGFKIVPTNEDSEKENLIDNDHRIDYETLQWIFIVFFTLIAVIDRFTVNLWPLWVDSPGPTIPGNFGVSCYTLISWISGRMMLVSSSYIFLFECWTFFNWLVEQKYVNKYIKIGDIHQANSKLHYYVGWIFIGIPVLLHVWSIVWAACFPMNDVFLYDTWMRPNDPETGKSIPFFDSTINLLSLGINDVYRIVSTSISFFILIPYSIIYWFRNHNWSIAQWVHLLGAMIYTVDLIRMYSHPHCWFFNVPFIAWWMIDRLYGIFFYRRCIANIVRKIHLDKEYVILYVRIPEKLHLLNSIGDVFYLNQLNCGWDRAHPFTVFQNRKKSNKMIDENKHLQPNWGGHKFSIYHNNDEDEESRYIMSRDSTTKNKSHSIITRSRYNDEKDDSDFDWNVGIIMQIFPDHPDCYNRKTWTKSIYSLDLRYLASLRCFGPYRSEYRILKKNPSTPLVLISTGA
eukprot:135813_1